jgi:hypothetical protein
MVGQTVRQLEPFENLKFVLGGSAPPRGNLTVGPGMAFDGSLASLQHTLTIPHYARASRPTTKAPQGPERGQNLKTIEFPL